MPDEPPQSQIDCSTAIQELWDYLDGELNAERMQAIRRHLNKCGHCLGHAEFAEFFLEALRKTREDCPCPAEVRAHVMVTLRAAGYSLH